MPRYRYENRQYKRDNKYQQMRPWAMYRENNVKLVLKIKMALKRPHGDIWPDMELVNKLVRAVSEGYTYFRVPRTQKAIDTCYWWQLEYRATQDTVYVQLSEEQLEKLDKIIEGRDELKKKKRMMKNVKREEPAQFQAQRARSFSARERAVGDD